MSPGFKRALIALGGLFVLALAWIWFMHTWEYVTREAHVGYHGEARENPYLAAERLFTRMGVATTSADNLHGLGGLLARDGTLFIPFARTTFSSERTAELLEWVRGGGHLVVVGGDNADDELLDGVGVRVAGVAEAEDEDEVAGADDVADEAAEADHEDLPPPTVPILLPDRTEPLLVSGTECEWSEFVTTRELRWSAPGVLAPRAVQVAEGDGLVTVLGASYFMSNAYIGDYDNSELAYRLATWGGRDGEVWLVYGYDVPWLLVILWRRGWMVLVSLGLLFGLWMLGHAQRFGPIVPLPVAARRGLLEHIQAVGRFLWRHGEGPAMLQEVRAAVLERAARRIPDWRGLDEAHRHRRLAQLSGLPAPHVSEALRGAGAVSRAQFASTMQRLERISSSL